MLRFLGFCAALTLSAVASAAVYKWVDAEGRVHYSDQPPGDQAQIVNIISRPTSHPAVAARSVSQSRQRETDATQENKQKTVDAQTQAVNADVAKAQGKKCDEAKERYRQAIESHRLYHQGANGEREYMSDAETSQERLNARRDVDASCTGPK